MHFSFAISFGVITGTTNEFSGARIRGAVIAARASPA